MWVVAFLDGLSVPEGSSAVLGRGDRWVATQSQVGEAHGRRGICGYLEEPQDTMGAKALIQVPGRIQTGSPNAVFSRGSFSFR